VVLKEKHLVMELVELVVVKRVEMLVINQMLSYLLMDIHLNILSIKMVTNIY
jgi:hypothetical protein